LLCRKRHASSCVSYVKLHDFDPTPLSRVCNGDGIMPRMPPKKR
jgi:hypothetical protein